MLWHLILLCPSDDEYRRALCTNKNRLLILFNLPLWSTDASSFAFSNSYMKTLSLSIVGASTRSVVFAFI
jgi:hypothetical protein